MPRSHPGILGTFKKAPQLILMNSQVLKPTGQTLDCLKCTFDRKWVGRLLGYVLKSWSQYHCIICRSFTSHLYTRHFYWEFSLYGTFWIFIFMARLHTARKIRALLTRESWLFLTDSLATFIQQRSNILVLNSSQAELASCLEKQTLVFAHRRQMKSP